MTSAPNSRRRALTAGLASSLWLAACGGGGGGGGNGSASVRALNLTSDVSSLDLYTGDSKQFTAVAQFGLASAATIEAGSYTLNVRNTSDNSLLYTTPTQYSIAKDQNYTAVVWGRQGSLRISTLPENEDPAGITTSATARLRLFNATIDSGPVDVYITSATGDFASAVFTQLSVVAGTLYGYRDLPVGTWRVRVTGPGDTSDVRMDLPAVTVTDKQFVSLVLTQSGNGGVMLNGTALVQQGAATTSRNTKARVRLAAGVANSANVSVTYGGTALFTNYRSPRVAGTGAYALVEAGSAVLAVTVNGTQISSTTQAFTAGSDYTVLAYGPSTAPAVSVLPDDNRLPSLATQTKVRIVNGLPGGDLITLLLDGRQYNAASDVAPGTASAYLTPASAGTQRLEVTNPDSIYTLSASSSSTALLQAGTVYTVFLLGGLTSTTAPFGRLITDR